MANNTTNRWNLLLDLFHSYGVLVSSILVGLALSFLKPSWVGRLEPAGDAYFNLLKMWALPIMMTSLILSVSKFWRIGNFQAKLQSILVCSGVSFGVAFLSVVVYSQFLNVGQNIDEASLTYLGALISRIEEPLDINFLSENIGQDKPATVLTFISSVIPDNIFTALRDDQAIQVVCFSLLFGLVMGINRSLKMALLPRFLEQVYETMTQITEWVGLFVPFGLCIQVASLSQNVNWSDFGAMRNFVVTLLVFFGITSIASILIIWKRSQRPLMSVVSALGESSLLVLSSQEGVTAIPSSITAFKGALGFDRETVDLVIPISITIFRVGSFVYLIAVVLFIAGLYDRFLNITDLFILIGGVALCSTATSTATGGDDLLFLIIPVLDILGLPLEAILVPLVAIDLLLQPFRELSTVHAGMALTALMATSTTASPLPQPSTQV
ncbi:MAG: dicarboxylate/amino acid:cation symporter [Prochlorothrix sp.]